ncbi:MAG: 16S rRNA (cytosine(967)-C(5))-methyltransferase RsmB [Pseudomonadota bacterium]
MSDAAQERARAAHLLHQVTDRRRTTDQALADQTVSPLVQELLYGSLRHYFSLCAAVNQTLRHPLKAKDHDLAALMIVGAYQLRYMRVPDHAAIHETVGACRALRKPWARGLVNAVLRKLAAADPPPAAADDSDHPPWLARTLRREYADAPALLAADNTRAPMTLRINRARSTVADYLARLDRAGLGHRAACATAAGDPGLAPAEETRVLEHPLPVAELPGYAEGLVSVQDAGAQFAALLLAPEPGDRLLDACAAPGGKLFHLLERVPKLRAAALEARPERLAQLREEGRRLGHDEVTYLHGDASVLDWWDGVPFQRILVDAPCSGTGTLRRHPDIKILRRAEDVDAFARLQQRLLENLWRVLEPGGTLLYCTCSILAAENDDVVAAFLHQREDAELSSFRLASGRPTRLGWQLLPIDPDTDGFYYARMNKAAA